MQGCSASSDTPQLPEYPEADVADGTVGTDGTVIYYICQHHAVLQVSFHYIYIMTDYIMHAYMIAIDR